MSQYDASAEPMWRFFSDQANLTPFEARPLQTNINSVNTVDNVWQRKSEGENAIVPKPHRVAFIHSLEKKNDPD
jgi:hypothetical protein